MVFEFTIVFNESMAEGDIGEPEFVTDLAACGYSPVDVAKQFESERRATVDICKRLGLDSWFQGERTGDGDLIVEVRNVTLEQARELIARFEDGELFECGEPYYEARNPCLFVADDDGMLTGKALADWLESQDEPCCVGVCHCFEPGF